MSRFQNDTFWLKAVGTSFRREAFEEAFGRHARGVDREIQIRLVREPSNKYDPNAVKVVYDDFHLGYLSRENALLYKHHVEEAGGELTMRARVIGGYTDHRGREKDFGVRIAAPEDWKHEGLLGQDNLDRPTNKVDLDDLFDF